MSEKPFPFLKFPRALPREIAIPIRVVGFGEIHADFADRDAGRRLRAATRRRGRDLRRRRRRDRVPDRVRRDERERDPEEPDAEEVVVGEDDVDRVALLELAPTGCAVVGGEVDRTGRDDPGRDRREVRHGLRPALARFPLRDRLERPRLEPAPASPLRRDPEERSVSRADLDLRAPGQEGDDGRLRGRLGPERDARERDERPPSIRGPGRRLGRRPAPAPREEQGESRADRGKEGAPSQRRRSRTSGIVMQRGPPRARASSVVESWTAYFLPPRASTSLRPRRRSSSRTIS